MSYNELSGDKPPITLRWRIVDGKIPLRERHIRSLDPLGLPAPLVAWIRSRLEWAVDNLLCGGAEGVLCLAIDPEKDVVVSLEDVREQPELTVEYLVANEGLVTGVAVAGEPLEGVVFFERDGKLFASTTKLVSAASSLAGHLASTLGFELEVAPASRADIEEADAVFLVSDEFGYVPIKLEPSASESGQKPGQETHPSAPSEPATKPKHENHPSAPLSTKLVECLSKVIP